MRDLAREASNPIIQPADVPPSQAGLKVVGVLNPAAIAFGEEILLLLRVAEMPVQTGQSLLIPILDGDGVGNYPIRNLEFQNGSTGLDTSDPRVIRHEGRTYLTSISHLRLARSRDGVRFSIDPEPTIPPFGALESYGVEDARITQIGEIFYVNYTAASQHGIVTALLETRDWKTFTRRGVIFHPQNKDVAIFPGRIAGKYFALHRPDASDFEAPSIWLASSPDLIHWGRHIHLISPRPGYWDAVRIGAGAPPIRTAEGWLEIYHGVSGEGHYALGALLLDLEHPSVVLGRSEQPILEPNAPYERDGFFANTVFCNGVVQDPDDRNRLRIYYGSADRCVAMAEGCVDSILGSLKAVAG